MSAKPLGINGVRKAQEERRKRALSCTPESAGCAESWAKQFHETYERLAPQFGYETKEETRQFQEDTPNGRLMIAVCREILKHNAPAQPRGD